MSYRPYGLTGADTVIKESGRPYPGASCTVWTQRTGGVRITDLRANAGTTVPGASITSVTADAYGSVGFWAPSGYVHLWLDTPGPSPRTLIMPSDSGAVATGGDEGQILAKASDADYDIEWRSAATLSGETPAEIGSTAAPGSTGLASDAGHVHGYGTLLDGLIPGPTAVSGYYYSASGHLYGGTKGNKDHTKVYTCPVAVPHAQTFDRIACYIDQAGDTGNLARLGIYESAANGTPGDLILDAGTVAADTTGVVEITISQSLPKGLYFLAWCSQGNASCAGLRCFRYSLYYPPLPFQMAAVVNGYGSYYNNAVTPGALPAAFSNLYYESADIPMIALRAA